MPLNLIESLLFTAAVVGGVYTLVHIIQNQDKKKSCEDADNCILMESIARESFYQDSLSIRGKLISENYCYFYSSVSNLQFMALSTAESLLLTLGICGSVHLLVTLLETIEESDRCDCTQVMQDFAKVKFWNSNGYHKRNLILPYFH
ncbi:hypothetical protein ILUMI_09556 [Ignelater luminosus]|uniref:Uncharacterized protein n=1 Tax=Ignelater luminosus TaxID=2038154 RepID=A0A8K0D4U3_IGNLU|nr:hypothetical protein ILUMI_09556 [Ignelater luminosus]